MGLGNSLGQASGSITISTTQAERAPTVMAGVASGIERSMGRVDSSVKKTEKGIGGLQSKFHELDSAIGASFLIAGITQLTRITFELAKTSAQAQITRESFDSLAAGVGQSSDKLLASMKDVSRGTISESDLIIGANRAIISGVADNTQELTQILEIARATGRAFGFETADAYSRIVRALAKLEPENIDELGIVMRLDVVFRAYAATLGTTADQLSEAQRRQAMYNEVVRQSQPAVDAAREAGDSAADTFDRVGATFDDAKKAAGDLFNTMGAPLWATIFIAHVKAVQAEMARLVTWIDAVQAAWQSLTGALGMGVGVPAVAAPSGGVPKWMTSVSPAASGPLGKMPPVEEREQVKLDWAAGITELNDRVRDELIEAERDHGRQREQTVEDYLENIRREARDFAIQRQRQEEELLDGISDIHQDAARRELRMAEDLARNIARAQADSSERIAEAREDTTKRLIELEEDFAKNRERAAEDHRDKILSAAGRLDAITLLEERKRWARENSDAKEAHDKQRDDLQEQLDERIADENEALAKSIANAKEAHDRQLADQREADRLRIEDMKADFAKRKEQEDADRAIRLGDMAQDHQDQLTEMDRAHALRLAQINIHAQDERDELDLKHKEAMIALGVRNDAWIAELERVEKARKKVYDDVWGTGAMTGHPSEADPYIGRTSVRASSSYPPATGQSAVGNSRTTSIGGVQISVIAAPGQSPYDIAAEVRSQFTLLLEELAN